jgi:hypothetical protein
MDTFTPQDYDRVGPIIRNLTEKVKEKGKINY